jgi:hypothetical protein
MLGKTIEEDQKKWRAGREEPQRRKEVAPGTKPPQPEKK